MAGRNEAGPKTQDRRCAHLRLRRSQTPQQSDLFAAHINFFNLTPSDCPNEAGPKTHSCRYATPSLRRCGLTTNSATPSKHSVPSQFVNVVHVVKRKHFPILREFEEEAERDIPKLMVRQRNQRERLAFE